MNLNNKVTLVGTIMSPFRFDHETCYEKFYEADLAVQRKSEVYDVIKIQISERLMDVKQDCTGCKARIHGEFRSFNERDGEASHLKLYVFVEDIEEVDSETPDFNKVCLDGYLVKQPVYRETPMGRKIADLKLAVNRAYGKSDYIHCIAWGRNAEYIAGFDVGTHIRAEGRIQSRTYIKESETRMVYEVSFNKLKVYDEVVQ